MRRSRPSWRSRSARSSRAPSARTADWPACWPTCAAIPRRPTSAKEAPMDDAELTPDERAALARVQHVLADPAVWAEPPADLQERVVAAVADAGGGRRRWLRYAAGGVAAAVLLAVGAAVGVQLNHHDDALQYA